MASPVIINSSPTYIRLPTTTPPSRADGGKKTASSSPVLSSPSAFAKPIVAGLRTECRAQTVPAPAAAGLGFATAGSRRREKNFQDDVDQEGKSPDTANAAAIETVARQEQNAKPAKRDGPHTGIVGKLKKPSRAPRAHSTVHAQVTSAASLQSQEIFGDGAAPRLHNGPIRKSPLEDITARPRPSPTHKSSIEVSDYAFGVYNLGMQTQVPTEHVVAKKPRRKKSLREVSKDESAPLKPQRRKAGSEVAMTELSVPMVVGTNQDKNAVSTGRPVAKRGKIKRAIERRHTKTQVAKSDILVNTAAPQTQKETLSEDREPAFEKSAYFSAASARDARDAVVGSESPHSRFVASKGPKWPSCAPADACAFNDTGLAAPRRVDWTPVKDTENFEWGVNELHHASSPQSDGPKLRLTEILGDCGYLGDSVRKAQIQRSRSGEAVTKRRRIELADAATLGLTARKDAGQELAEPKPKKPAGRKKLQTITALATAAYQRAPKQSDDQTAASEFFASRNEKSQAVKDSGGPVEKSKKPRKPRKKKGNPAEGDEVPTAAPKKARKTKVKFDESACLTKLYSPAQAAAQMEKQDFLFGTSSQLAVDEPPGFIRDVQAAVLASEMEAGATQRDAVGIHIASSAVVPSQLRVTPRKSKSCAKVPTAPHGTCLSLEQADRELWCVASRDQEGGFMREPERLCEGRDADCIYQSTKAGAVLSEHAVEMDWAHNTPVRDRREDVVHTSLPDRPAPFQEPEHKQVVVDLSNSSPTGHSEINGEDPAVVLIEHQQSLDLPTTKTHQHSTTPLQTEVIKQATAEEKGWMVISSDGPESTAANARSPSSKLNRDNHTASPVRKRNALQPLDGNANLLIHFHSKVGLAEHTRAFTSVASDLAPGQITGKLGGRPRRGTPATATLTACPRKRGRPSKRSLIATNHSPESVTFRKPKVMSPASQPLQSPSGWLDVDEISDSDSPVTPSPPRRRPSSSPPAVPTLDISIDGSPLAKLKDKAPTAMAATSTFKPGEPQWPAIRAEVFPKITAKIKNAPRSTDPLRPSWYQKILMYDPITLEELTGWLNEQGLRIAVHKMKPKAKKRGRKKRDADGNVIDDASNVEWESHEEPLQPWMVQKWCEERSICCVWAGGGWGGRTRH